MQPIQISGETVKDAYRFTGHTGGIRAMLGWQHFIISGSDDNSIKIWSASTGNCIKTLKGHTSRILCLTMWNGYVVSSGADSQIKIWDIVSGKCKKTLKECTCDANSLVSTSELLFAGGKDGVIYVWTKRYQLKGKLLGHSDWVNKLLIYNENYLISGSDDKTIRIWDLSTEKCIFTFDKHTKGVCSLCTVGSTLISGGTDFSIILWNLQTGDLITTLKGHFATVSSLCVYQDRYLISTDLNALVVIWDMKTKYRILYEMTLHGAEVYSSMIFEDRLYTCSKDGSIVKWPAIQYFRELSALLTRCVASKDPSGKGGTAEEYLQLQKEEFEELISEKEMLMAEKSAKEHELMLETELRKNLQSELTKRCEELNELRKEATAWRSAESQYRKRMIEETRVLSRSLQISLAEVRKEFARCQRKEATVFEAFWFDTPVAVKAMKSNAKELDTRYDWLHLCEQWSQLHHPNILPLYGVQFESFQSASLVMELCPGSLKDVVQYSQAKKRPLSLATKIGLLLQIARAVSFLHHHNPPIVHGSLCPLNVLLTSSLVPRLTDIGTSFLERLLYDRCYEGEFVAPEEQSVEATSSEAGDVFSLGKVILYVVKNGETMGNDVENGLSDVLKMMIRRYCNENPSNRPSIDVVVEDLERWKRSASREIALSVDTTPNLLYSRENGCFLF